MYVRRVKHNATFQCIRCGARTQFGEFDQNDKFNCWRSDRRAKAIAYRYTRQLSRWQADPQRRAVTRPVLTGLNEPRTQADLDFCPPA